MGVWCLVGSGGGKRKRRRSEVGEGFMSQRGDRGEGHARRPGRSSSFGGGHRGGGGVGGAGKGGGGSSGQPPLATNRR